MCLDHIIVSGEGQLPRNSTCGLPMWTSEWKRQYEGEPGNFPSEDPGNRMNRMQVPSKTTSACRTDRYEPHQVYHGRAEIHRPKCQYLATATKRHLVSFRVRSGSGQQKELHSQRPFSGSIRVHFGSIGVISRFFWLNRSLSGRTRPSHRGCGWRPSSATNPSC